MKAKKDSFTFPLEEIIRTKNFILLVKAFPIEIFTQKNTDESEYIPADLCGCWLHCWFSILNKDFWKSLLFFLNKFLLFRYGHLLTHNPVWKSVPSMKLQCMMKMKFLSCFTFNVVNLSCQFFIFIRSTVFDKWQQKLRTEYETPQTFRSYPGRNDSFQKTWIQSSVKVKKLHSTRKVN